MKDLDLDYWTILRLLLSVREIESRGVGTNVGQDMKLKRKLGTSLKCCIVFTFFRDASFGTCLYNLTILDCLRAIQKVPHLKCIYTHDLSKAQSHVSPTYL